MYAGVSSSTNNVAVHENDNSDIPEWKKLLIMKKRTGGGNVSLDDHRPRNPDANIVRNGDISTCDTFPSGCSSKFNRPAKVVEQDFREISPPKTVTIGNVNVELRSVAESQLDSSSKVDECTAIESEDATCEDLQYGPGIVDRLRAKFLNMGAKKQRKPVVRRFSSLENLPGSNSGPYRVNTRGVRQNGFKVGTGNYYGSGNVKKALSMETLISSSPEQQIFSTCRRPTARYVGGVKARILAKNITPITMFTDENEEPNAKSPSPASSPRLFAKSVRRWDYNRTVSAPNINEDELPKPDTVKHVKKIFESPTPGNCSSEKSSHPVRFRKIPGTSTTPNPAPTSVCNSSAISGSIRPAVKILEDANPDAKPSAKESTPDLIINNIPPQQKKDESSLSPTMEVCGDFYPEINKGGYSPVLDDNLSVLKSCNTPPAGDSNFVSVDGGVHNRLIPSPERDPGKVENDFVKEEPLLKVTPESLPLESYKHSEVLSQGGRAVTPTNGAEQLEDDLISPLPQPVSPDGDMVVAAAAASSDPFAKKGATWQKAPPATTSVVFDFRGKDVKPNISLQPAPFGCRPAKVSRNSNSQKKRSSSPLRTGVNGVSLPPKDYDVEDDANEDEEDEEDWDEMDIGADLPAISGIVFSGENVKVGRGAFLEKRNKKLTIQFDDHATSTFEYPSENASPSPMEENGIESDSSFDPVDAIASVANSRIGLSNYTPQVLGSNTDFELGVSQPNHRPNLSSPKSQMNDDVPILDVIPANPDNAGGWSATETVDILF